MPRERREHCFISILVSVDKIKRHTHALTYEQFVSNELVFSAMSRELQLIGELIKKLLLAPSLLQNSNINTRGIIGFRNLVVHEYFSLNPEIVFEVVTKEVPVLEQDILETIGKIKDKIYIFQALEDTKTVLHKINRHESLEYLSSLSEILRK